MEVTAADMSETRWGGGLQTWDGIGGQFACGQHDVPEVERAEVNLAQLHAATAASKVAERGCDPAQGGKVTTGQHIDVRRIGRLLLHL